MGDKLFRLVDGVLVPLSTAEEAALRAEWAANAAANPPRVVPAALLRERLEAAGLYEAAVSLLTPGQILKLATLREGIDPADAGVRDLLTAIGADPDEILAP